jgi:hypothetical protein
MAANTMTTTQHFNELSEPGQERLVLLMEECAEVIAACAKILRHGYDSNWGGRLPEANREALEREMGDLTHAYQRMVDAGDLSVGAVASHGLAKSRRIGAFLHHQPPAARDDAVAMPAKEHGVQDLVFSNRGKGWILTCLCGWSSDPEAHAGESFDWHMERSFAGSYPFPTEQESREIEEGEPGRW